mmetsp:Transcript_4537/g.12655  ORF Transcript_4537/g.12655 Transcript_4537/m.12655 type:complete len:184 (-) Transcript_4537:341-892(-)|eukprot:CAMPEP_0117656974 /NCGR_PEP_ID=MMETSP0804-20121206/5087_1 /TAXON_ID=1074897 /ORGANISM="Tetraselmis astigmatica, Strain CCMP880" /LENGTH=183 /DNA_ID=CAMNT_0005463405 /DNA_START=45 /DNA_END=596 /DNA_ORIENTATION=-
MPSQFCSTNLLPKQIADIHRSLKFGDSRKVNEKEWESTYHKQYDSTVRVPPSLDTIANSMMRPPHQYTTGYVLTGLSREAIQELREQLLSSRGIEGARQAESILKGADPSGLGLLARSDFVKCMELLGVSLSRHHMEEIMQQFGVDRIATTRAVDYYDFLCGALPEVYNTPCEDDHHSCLSNH